MEEKNKNDKEKTFEESILELENLVKELESGNCPLDDAINKFTKGMKLAKYCGDKLTAATEKVNKILTETGELQDFDTPTE